MRATSWLLAVLCALGCGNSAHSGSASDGGSSVVDLGGGIDLAPPADLTIPTACNPVDDQSDGQLCPTKTACAGGTIAVEIGGACRCYRQCTLDVECPCDRTCDSLTASDGGAAGGACLPGNGAGQRCGQDATTGALFGNGLCAQGLACVDSDASHRYCSYACSSLSDCPAQTTCDTLSDMTQACGLAAGSATTTCAPNSNDCAVGQLCDDTSCAPQCDGPGATCTSGSCSALSDGGKVIGYVCK